MTDETFLRLAPAQPDVPLTIDEALPVAQSAFYDARRTLADALTRVGYLTSMLYGQKTINRARLKGMRNETRVSIEKLMAVEAELNRAIEAIDATEVRP